MARESRSGLQETLGFGILASGLLDGPASGRPISSVPRPTDHHLRRHTPSTRTQEPCGLTQFIVSPDGMGKCDSETRMASALA